MEKASGRFEIKESCETEQPRNGDSPRFNNGDPGQRIGNGDPGQRFSNGDPPRICTQCRIRPALGLRGLARCGECAVGRFRIRTKTMRNRIGRAPASHDTELREMRAETAKLLKGIDAERPATRGDCRDGPRPCPWVSCRHHLYLDSNPRNGSLKFNFPDKEPWELTETCSLDAAERGGVTLEEVAAASNITRERVRQIEVMALIRLRRNGGDLK